LESYVCPEILDFEKLYQSDPDAQSLICANGTSKNVMMESLKALCLDGSKDLNFTASCECGRLSGNYWDQADGVECKYCHTKCQTNFARKLKFRGWLEVPEYAPPVLHPKVYAILSKWLGSVNKKSIMEYLLDPTLELPEKLVGKVGQGASYFYQHFDELMNFFLNDYQPLKTGAAPQRAKYIPDFLRIYRHMLFVRHIPIMNQSMHMITKSGTMQYADECLEFVLQAMAELNLLQTVYNSGVMSDKHIDQRLFEFLKAMVNYAEAISKKQLTGKRGIIRHITLGSRFHCSFRGVISPLYGVQQLDELHLPWKAAVIVYRLEIINILVNRMGYTVPEAIKKHEYAENNYDPLVDQIFQTLIKECQDTTGLPGMAVTFGRNPTLAIGSIYLLFVTKVKPDINDTTISLSDILRAPPNLMTNSSRK